MPAYSKRRVPHFTSLLALSVFGACLCLVTAGKSNAGLLHVNESEQIANGPAVDLQPKSLCEIAEHIIFNCSTKRAAKIVSLCASKDVGKEQGHLQYRFGLPGKVELVFPKGREKTQQLFRYKHYFRAQFDMTEVNFAVDGYEYSIFADYNGEEKPAISEQGIRITSPGNTKDVTLVCVGKAKIDFSNLQDILPSEQQ
jgi:hypothetical protein